MKSSYFSQIEDLIQQDYGDNYKSLIKLNQKLQQKLVSFCRELDFLLQKKQSDLQSKTERTPKIKLSIEKVLDQNYQNNIKAISLQERDMTIFQQNIAKYQQEKYLENLIQESNSLQTQIKQLQLEVRQKKLVQTKQGQKLIRPTCSAPNQGKDLQEYENKKIESTILLKKLRQQLNDIKQKNTNLDQELENLSDVQEELNQFQDLIQKRQIFQKLQNLINIEEKLILKSQELPELHKIKQDCISLRAQINNNIKDIHQCDQIFQKSEEYINEILSELNIKKEHKIQMGFILRSKNFQDQSVKSERAYYSQKKQERQKISPQ